MSKRKKLHGATPEARLGELLNNAQWCLIAPGGKYEAEFEALLRKYGREAYGTGMAAFTMGWALAKREG